MKNYSNMTIEDVLEEAKIEEARKRAFPKNEAKKTKTLKDLLTPIELKLAEEYMAIEKSTDEDDSRRRNRIVQELYEVRRFLNEDAERNFSLLGKGRRNLSADDAQHLDDKSDEQLAFLEYLSDNGASVEFMTEVIDAFASEKAKKANDSLAYEAVLVRLKRKAPQAVTTYRLMVIKRDEPKAICKWVRFCLSLVLGCTPNAAQRKYERGFVAIQRVVFERLLDKRK